MRSTDEEWVRALTTTSPLEAKQDDAARQTRINGTAAASAALGFWLTLVAVTYVADSFLESSNSLLAEWRDSLYVISAIAAVVLLPQLVMFIANRLRNQGGMVR